MAITTNHTTETITAEGGVLTIGSDGAIKLPIGPTTSRPDGIKGLVRFSDDTTDPEYYDGASWQLVSNKDYVDTAAQNLQNQINNIISNIDPEALDSLSELVKAFQDADTDIATIITNLSDALATEIQNRTDADNTLQTNIDTLSEQQNTAINEEADIRSAADIVLQENIDTLQTTLQNQIDYFVSNLDPEALDSLTEIVKAFQDSDFDIVTTLTTLSDSLTTEIQNRTDGDTDLDLRVTAVEDQVNGKIGDLTGLTTDSKTTIVSAINEVDANLDAFETNVNNALSDLQSDISGTITNLTLDDLSDVTITTPTDGQVLVYDVVSGQFRTQTQALNVVTRTFIADGETFDFDMNTSVSTIHNIVVTINGILQEPFYSFVLTNNSIITFDEAPESGDKIQIKILTTSAQTDRPRPRITEVSYGTLGIYATINIIATDTTYGTGIKIGDRMISRIDYISANSMQVMIPLELMSDTFWSNPQDLTLIDTSGNEFTYKNMIYYGAGKPQFTNSNSYIGSFSGGDIINFPIAINNGSNITLSPAYAGDTAISWLSISGTNIVGTAPINSNPSRYEISVTASNGSVNITKNYWLLVV